MAPHHVRGFDFIAQRLLAQLSSAGIFHIQSEHSHKREMMSYGDFIITRTWEKAGVWATGWEQGDNRK